MLQNQLTEYGRRTNRRRSRRRREERLFSPQGGGGCRPEAFKPPVSRKFPSAQLLQRIRWREAVGMLDGWKRGDRLHELADNKT
jgi:hypothetical protein